MDNGVFYVTVEDNGVRRIIAKSRGSVDRLKRLQNILSGLDHNSDTDVAAVVGLQDLSEARSAALEILKSKKKNIAPFSDSLQVLEKTPVLGSGVQAAHPDTLANLMGEMTFVPEIEPYLGHADIEIEPGETNLLPDPRAGWVDMVYRIKPGRADNVFGPVGKGEVEIWANGKHIVKVRGNLGNQLLKPPEKKKVYFKFGIYRDTTPGVLTS